jgi:hypothetical protein
MWKEITLSSILLVLLALFINPYEIFGMPTTSQMVLLGMFTVLFMMFAVFVWQENPQDERESHHVFSSGRVAFLTGSAILACGIVEQILLSALDPWLPIAVGGMIFSKTISLWYMRKKC